MCFQSIDTISFEISYQKFEKIAIIGQYQFWKKNEGIDFLLHVEIALKLQILKFRSFLEIF